MAVVAATLWVTHNLKQRIGQDKLQTHFKHLTSLITLTMNDLSFFESKRYVQFEFSCATARKSTPGAVPQAYLTNSWAPAVVGRFQHSHCSCTHQITRARPLFLLSSPHLLLSTFLEAVVTSISYTTELAATIRQPARVCELPCVHTSRVSAAQQQQL